MVFEILLKSSSGHVEENIQKYKLLWCLHKISSWLIPWEPDNPYECTINLVTTLDLVTVFWETKSVTKSRFHCTYCCYPFGSWQHHHGLLMEYSHFQTMAFRMLFNAQSSDFICWILYKILNTHFFSSFLAKTFWYHIQIEKKSLFDLYIFIHWRNDRSGFAVINSWIHLLLDPQLSIAQKAKRKPSDLSQFFFFLFLCSVYFLSKRVGTTTWKKNN